MPPRVLLLEPILPRLLLRPLIPFWLFERSCRPRNKNGQRALLQWIRLRSWVSSQQRHYALVALAYWAVDANDQWLAADCLREIGALLSDARQRCQVGDCCGSNRENPVKWLISLHTSAYHLGLVLDQRDATLQRLGEVEWLVSVEVVQTLDPDVACRLTSNLMRCLSLSAISAWRAGQTGNQQRLLLRLEHLNQDLRHRHASHSRQPFHKRVSTALLCDLKRLQEADSCQALEQLAQNLVRSNNPLLIRRFVDWFSSPSE